MKIIEVNKISEMKLPPPKSSSPSSIGLVETKANSKLPSAISVCLNRKSLDFIFLTARNNGKKPQNKPTNERYLSKTKDQFEKSVKFGPLVTS